MGDRRIVLFDIDHTVSNAFWRDPMISATPHLQTWDEYHSSAAKDEPLQDVIGMVNALHFSGWLTFGMTARPEKWRKMTMDWFIKYDVHLDELLMRPDNAFRPSVEIKLALVKERFGDNPQDQIALILEDRTDVCMAFRDLGITVLQVYGRQK
jgi:hypothetical protein